MTKTEDIVGVHTLLEIEHDRLGAKLEELLAEFGVRVQRMPTSGSMPVAVISDMAAGERSSHPGAAVIRLWQQGRYRHGARPEGNPFADAVARSWVGADPEVDASEIRSTLEHIAAGSFLPLTKLLSPNAEIETAEETESSRKHFHLERLEAFLGERVKANSSITQGLMLALDELFTNAVYNAPLLQDGSSMQQFASRSSAVRSPRRVVIQFGVDAEYVGVAVRDYYGSLSIDQVISNLARCYGPEGAGPVDKLGGAGLGFFMLLQHANRLVVNVKSGQFAEIIVLRARKQRARQFAQTSPTLNLCVVDGADALTTSRRYERFAVHLPAHVLLENQIVKATICDLSEGGAFIAAEVMPQSGEVLKLKILTDDDDEPPKVVRAIVCWSGESSVHRCRGFGVSFVSQLDPETLASLKGKSSI